MARPKGGYRVKNKRVPGVTTIIGRFKDSGGLLWWAFEQGKAAERGEINSLYDKRDEAGDAGTLAHTMVENHINGRMTEQPDKNATDIQKLAYQGYQNYLNWQENNRIKIIEQEIDLVSDLFEYGGCPDAIGMDAQGRACLLDWKTSNGVYPDYIIQLAAYKHLWEWNHSYLPLDGGFHLCRFSKENADFAHHYWSELDDAWDQFKLFLKAYHIDKKLKKRV